MKLIAELKLDNHFSKGKLNIITNIESFSLQKHIFYAMDEGNHDSAQIPVLSVNCHAFIGK